MRDAAIPSPDEIHLVLVQVNTMCQHGVVAKLLVYGPLDQPCGIQGTARAAGGVTNQSCPLVHVRVVFGLWEQLSRECDLSLVDVKESSAVVP